MLKSEDLERLKACIEEKIEDLQSLIKTFPNENYGKEELRIYEELVSKIIEWADNYGVLAGMPTAVMEEISYMINDGQLNAVLEDYAVSMEDLVRIINSKKQEIIDGVSSDYMLNDALHNAINRVIGEILKEPVNE